MAHQPTNPTTRPKAKQARNRVLNAVLSDQALTQARIAALNSNMLFKDYLDQLLRQAEPFNQAHSLDGDHQGDT